jgi:hypothetical protein
MDEALELGTKKRVSLSSVSAVEIFRQVAA